MAQQHSNYHNHNHTFKYNALTHFYQRIVGEEADEGHVLQMDARERGKGVEVMDALRGALQGEMMESAEECALEGIARYNESNLNLSKDEFLAIYLYCCHRNPQTTIYRLLNKDLMNQDPTALFKWRYYTQLLFEAFTKLTPWKYSKEVYRGVDKDLPSLFPDKYQLGKSITWPAWTSTTNKLKVVKSAFTESKTRKTIFSINSFNGRSIKDFSEEEEILLPPGCRFEIYSITPSDTYVLIQLKEIPENTDSLTEKVYEGGLRPGEVEFLSGYELLLKSQFHNSLLYFERAAEKKHFLSLVFLSYIYSTGGYVGFKNDTKRDYYLNEAERHYHDQYANSTQSYVMNGVGLYFYLKQDYNKAVGYFEKGSTQNDAFAQCRLGHCYEAGKGVSASIEKAFEFYKKSANQGNAVAQANCGLCYFKGEGVNVNSKKAMKLLKKSANQGVSSAQNTLGFCYLNGIGRAMNLEKAFQLFENGASKGDVDALCSLGFCYENGKGVDVDLQKAVQYYEKGAEIGHSISECNLGSCYENGRGVDVDLKKAFQLYQDSANHGNTRALCCLGMCYEYGRGVSVDMDKAVLLYEQSANFGDCCGQFNLGVCYEYGRGVYMDKVKALQLYKMGAKQGNTDAKKSFKKLKAVI